MAVVRSYVNGFEIVDRTDDLVNIPNTWGLVQSLNIFREEGVSQHTIMVEEINKSLGLVKDKVRGTRGSVGRDATRKMHAFPIPHFPLDDEILPRDIQGNRAFGSPEQEEALAPVRLRKMEFIRQSHAATLEFARCQALTAGTVYAPNGTVSVDWYSSFGIARHTTAFALTTGTTDVKAKIEEVIAHIQDNQLSGEVASEIVFLCSPGFFSALVGHDSIKAAYQFYSSTQEPLRNRLDAPGLDSRYRQFVHAGARFIEYRGNYAGSVMIPTDEAYALPLGTMDSFYTYFGPAETFDTVNTQGQPAYLFEYPDNRGRRIDIESESNFVNMLRRPAVVVKCTKV